MYLVEKSIMTFKQDSEKTYQLMARTKAKLQAMVKMAFLTDSSLPIAAKAQKITRDILYVE